jgi:hypothetical protein
MPLDTPDTHQDAFTGTLDLVHSYGTDAIIEVTHRACPRALKLIQYRKYAGDLEIEDSDTQ